VVSFGDPNLAYDNGPTSQTNGTFVYVMDLEDFTSSADIDAGHYVGMGMTVGGVALQEGDLLLSTASSETLTSVNSLSVADEDVFIFRPIALNDYSSGTFYMFIDGSDEAGGVGPLTEVEAVTLVEVNTSVAGTNLFQGDVLISNHNDHDVWLFRPTSFGSTTSGALSLFIQGDDIDINEEWEGIELIEIETDIGDVTLQAGQILGTLEVDQAQVGANGIPADVEDIFILDLTALGDNTEGTATLLFNGSDVGLTNDENENIDMVTLNSNGVGSLSAIPLAITNPGFEAGDLSRWTKTGDLFETGGLNQWGAVTSAYAMSSPHGGTYFAGGRATGQIGSGPHMTGLYQRLDISAYASQIDIGTATVNVAGFGHGETNQDKGKLRIAFYDAVSGGTQLGSNVDSNEATQSNTWTALAISGTAVPSGTRSIELILLGEKVTAGSYLDAGIDDVSAILSYP